jgi:chaperonin GroES
MVKNKNTKELNITPLGARVIVRPILEDEKTASGIIIPDTVDKEKPQEGVVVAVGKGEYRDAQLVPMEVKKGDKILFSKYGYDEITVGGEEYFVLKEENIIAIIK